MPGRRFALLAVMLEAMVVERPQPTADKLQHLCLDKGDDKPTGHDAVGPIKTSHIAGTSARKSSIPRARHDPAWRRVVERRLSRPSSYGSTFIQSFKQRLGLDRSHGKIVTVLCPVVMGPWVTETPIGSFVDALEREFRKVVLAANHEACSPRMKGY